MARKPSVILTPAEKKAATANAKDAVRAAKVALAAAEKDRKAIEKDYAAKLKKDDLMGLNREEIEQYRKDFAAFSEERIKTFRSEAKSYYQKLVESYPNSEWARKAADRLIAMGTTNVKEELDS